MIASVRRAGLLRLAAVGLAVLAQATYVGAQDRPAEFLLGADVSSLDRLEIRGAAFDEGAAHRTALGILQTHRFDVLRLSVLVEPATGFLGLSRSTAMGARIKGAGFRLFVDLHYSDAPAGAGVQEKPRRWRTVPSTALADTIRSYTRRVLTTFAESGATPDFVQVGREVGHGFLGDEGRVGRDSGAAAWDAFAGLLAAGVGAVHEVAPKARVVLHLEGGDAEWSATVVDSLVARGVTFDLVGVSWYPWYHGTLVQLRETLELLAEHSGKGVLVLETAYPWTLRGADDVFNEVSQSSQLHPGYEATPDGQKRWVADVLALVRALPSGRGVIYREPTEISAKGVGTTWDNLALFDASGRGLPALDAFQESAGTK